jgi:glutaredoxin 3
MIKIYSKDDCAYCVDAKSLLTQKELDYTEVMIGIDITREEFVKEHPNIRSVPAIFIDNEYIGGFKQLDERIS